MAKPDWGELQQRFLSDHAATGVSPKDWCEAQGLMILPSNSGHATK